MLIRLLIDRMVCRWVERRLDLRRWSVQRWMVWRLLMRRWWIVERVMIVDDWDASIIDHGR